MVAIQINFATEGIPAGTSFKIRLLMDGIPIDNTVNWATGNGNWFLWWSGWYAAPGQRQLDAVLDVDNQVAETNEADNTGQQSFTPFRATDLPQKLMFPISGVRIKTSPSITMPISIRGMDLLATIEMEFSNTTGITRGTLVP